MKIDKSKSAVVAARNGLGYSVFPFARSKGSSEWTVKVYSNGAAWCDCPAWRFHRGDERTCKHVEALIVEDNYEKVPAVGEIDNVAKIIRGGAFARTKGG